METSFEEIQEAIQIQDVPRARQLLRQAFRANPTADVYYLAAQVAINAEQQAAFLQKAITLDPFHEEAFQALETLKSSAPKPAAHTPPIRPLYSAASDKASASPELADGSARLVAYVIDALFLGIVNILLYIVLSLLTTSSFRSRGYMDAYSLAFGLLIFMFYHAYFLTVKQGQTPGKSLMKIRIVRLDGKAITFGTALMRNVVGYMLSQSFFGLGFLWVLIDEQHQAWHDKLVKTIVVKDNGRTTKQRN